MNDVGRGTSSDPGHDPGSDPGSPRGAEAPGWWPQGEAWPPSWGRHSAWSRGGWHSGDWHGGRRRRGGPWAPLGCAFILFGLFSAGTVVVGIWAAAAILGVVEAPAIVVGAGLVAFVIVVIGTLLAARAFRRMTAPLDELIAASGRIEAGDYTVRVPVSGNREVRSLSRAFNQMSTRLEAADTRRRAFLADVTHELRTPLTIMQGQLEAMGDGVYEPDVERMAGLLSQARHMSSLVEDLHTISLAEVGGLGLDLQDEDLGAIVDEVVAGAAPAAELASVVLRAEHPDGPVPVRSDRRAMARVLTNLVANAIRHTPAGGSVVVSTERDDGDEVAVSVTDTGSGMPPELAARAFERFEKGPESDGSGLGLAIARDLVEAQDGRITLTSAPGAGTTARVTLPRAGA